MWGYLLAYKCENSGDHWTEYENFKKKSEIIDYINEKNIQPEDIIFCYQVFKKIEFEPETVVTKLKIKE